ncbi:hypothetical protein SCUP515_00477 [Seiridium cupressi]
MPENGKEEYMEALASLRLSEKIHIAGFTREARFIAHCLAGTPDLPPPQLLAHQRSSVDQWGASQRKLTLKTKEGLQTSHEVLIPHYIGKSKSRYGVERPRLKHVANLIISTVDKAVVPTLLSLRDSINQDTTICLLTPGMGVVEHLCKCVFPDPTTRPTFILAHSTHSIIRDPSNPDDQYSLQFVRGGKLALSGLLPETQENRTEVDTWDRIARRARTQHFLKLLYTVPGLNATGLPMSKFLHEKLPSMIFSCVADAISVALGFRYERIHEDKYGKRLWNNLFNETVAIISALPELEESPEIVEYFRGRNFSTEAMRYLQTQSGVSQWIHMVKSGHRLPLQNLNGWFVTKAKEAGVKSVYHRGMINMIRAKEAARAEELKMDMPLYHSPYMLDSDCMRDEDEAARPARRLVYTNK